MSMPNEQPSLRPRLVVDNGPLAESLDLFQDFDRALIYFWLLGVELDAAFEVLTWSRIATRNDNSRPT